MNVILILIPVSLAFAGSFLIAFIWSVRNGQFEDTDTPAMRILAEEESVGSPGHRSSTKLPGSRS